MTTLAKKKKQSIEYPTSDGKPMAETDAHRVVIFDLIARLDYWYADDPKTYVSGDLLVFYEKGNHRKHVAPDVFVAPGAAKKLRPNYLIWKERKRIQWITEVTSSSTRNEDIAGKFVLYRDVLKVNEYFLFDPFGDYLHPNLKGYRLVRGDYVPLEPVDGRFPSEVLGLHLEVAGQNLRLYNPATQLYIPTPKELAEEAGRRADRMEEEVAKLRRELEKYRRRNGA